MSIASATSSICDPNLTKIIMEHRYRIVTQLPLTELWDEHSNIPSACCLGTISRDLVRQLLREGPVRFVVADVGHPLCWIKASERFSFWKSISTYVSANADGLDINSTQKIFLAWQWRVSGFEPVIVLQKFH